MAKNQEIIELSENSKSWPFIEAHRILKRITKNFKEEINLQTGYGPSGLPHIGTFGEVARTTMILNALEQISDKKVNLIAFSDDMDGLRKIPDNVPNQELLSKYLNQSLTNVPDPFEKYNSFGEHNNSMLKKFLDDFRFKYNFKSATDLYKSGFFNEQLKNVLSNYQEIKNIVLPTLGEERRKTYSPFLPVCTKTNQVLEVEILEVNLENNSIIYLDKDNEKVETSVLDGNCKLQWKVDWAMRWIALEVDYEMYGKDLIPTFQLSSKICKALGGNPPENFFYELFLDQNGEKISKSKGNGLSIEEWLSYAPQETLSYFMYQNPRRAKKLFLEVIPKSTDEFLAHLNKFDDQSIDQKIENPYWHISNGLNSLGNMPISYNLILNLVSASGSNDPELILDFVKKYVGKIEEDSLEFILKLIDGVINYYNSIIKSTISYKKPNQKEVLIFEDLIKRLSAMNDSLSAEEIQTEIYQIGKDHNFTNLRDWFSLIYEVLFGKTEGPRFGSFVAIYGIEKTIQLVRDRVF